MSITISQFQQIKSIEGQTFEFGIEKEIAVLSVLSGIDTDTLESYPKDKLIGLTHKHAQDMDISEQPTCKFRIGRRVFDVCLEANKLTAEQFILIARYTESEANTIENLHYIMAALTQEHKLLIGLHPFAFDYEGKAELFRQRLTIDKAYGTAVFFCEVYKSWLNATEIYLVEEAKKLQTMVKESLIQMK